MQTLLNEIDTQINRLEDSSDYLLPNTGEASEIIQDYLNYRQEQRIRIQQQQDLRELRELVQTEIDRTVVETQEKTGMAEAAIRAKNIAAETTKAIKRLSKLDLRSPDAAKTLLNLTENRR